MQSRIKKLDEGEGWRNIKELKDYIMKYSVMHLLSNANICYKHGVHQLETTKEKQRYRGKESSGNIPRSCDNWGSTFMISYNVILKGLNGYQRSSNAFELLGGLIWTLVYASIFTAERWEQTGERASEAVSKVREIGGQF